MATVTITINAGTLTSTASATATNARAAEFAADLIAYYGGETPLTQQEAVDRFTQGYLDGMVQFAKGLKQNRLDESKTIADDLLGNT